MVHAVPLIVLVLLGSLFFFMDSPEPEIMGRTQRSVNLRVQHNKAQFTDDARQTREAFFAHVRVLFLLVNQRLENNASLVQQDRETVLTSLTMLTKTLEQLQLR